MSLAEQLGNVGSEYERAWKAKLEEDQPRFNSASERLLELMDLTIADPRYRNLRLKELCRVREAVCEELFSQDSDQSLQSYFYQFAAAARSHRLA